MTLWIFSGPEHRILLVHKPIDVGMGFTTILHSTVLIFIPHTI